MLFTEKHRQDLDVKGYTVVENVLTDIECDQYKQSYKEWLSEFPDGQWPFTMHSLIQRYNIGHHDATWRARLKSKKVFSQLWKTDKLLTSVDAIAIGRPPEDGEENFATDGQHWLHVDQDAERVGLHAYQGTLYLEDVAEDDWTFHVMEKSHLYLDRFYEQNLKAALKSSVNKYYHIRDEDQEWFESRGCITMRVSVPRGGMVLWDSRLVHANARPKKDRKHPGRWRYAVMICMTPALWASKYDLHVKKEAYNDVTMTTHWPSQGVRAMPKRIPSDCAQDIGWLKKLPDIASTTEVKQLCGVLPYNFKDDKSNGPEWCPVWKKNILGEEDPGTKVTRGWRIARVASGISLAVGLLAWMIMVRRG